MQQEEVKNFKRVCAPVIVEETDDEDDDFPFPGSLPVEDKEEASRHVRTMHCIIKNCSGPHYQNMNQEM